MERNPPNVLWCNHAGRMRRWDVLQRGTYGGRCLSAHARVIRERTKLPPNTQYDFEDAINDYTNMVNNFLTNPSINNFHALDPYVGVGVSNPEDGAAFVCILFSLVCYIDTTHIRMCKGPTNHRIQGPNAVNAYAKAAVVYIALQQQLAMLGSDRGELDNIQVFAQQASSWLNARIAFYTRYAAMMP